MSLLRKILLVFAILILGAAVYFNLYFPNQSQLKKIQSANQKVTADIKKVEKEIEDLKDQNEKVSKDPQVMEKYARDELGVAKPGEIVVDIK